MIVFFSTCELVEFHYTLFIQTLLGGSEAPASPRLTFLRLHGGLEQEVSTITQVRNDRARVAGALWASAPVPISST